MADTSQIEQAQAAVQQAEKVLEAARPVPRQLHERYLAIGAECRRLIEQLRDEGAAVLDAVINQDRTWRKKQEAYAARLAELKVLADASERVITIRVPDADRAVLEAEMNLLYRQADVAEARLAARAEAQSKALASMDAGMGLIDMEARRLEETAIDLRGRAAQISRQIEEHDRKQLEKAKADLSRDLQKATEKMGRR
jgi:hypothetical protein